MFGWFKKANPALTQDIVRYQQATRHARAGTLGGSDRLSCVFALVLDQPEWDYARDRQSAESAATEAAEFIGFIAPFDKEEKAIMDFLVGRFAGRKIATFAWSIYADQLRDAETRTG